MNPGDLVKTEGDSSLDPTVRISDSGEFAQWLSSGPVQIKEVGILVSIIGLPKRPHDLHAVYVLAQSAIGWDLKKFWKTIKSVEAT